MEFGYKLATESFGPAEIIEQAVRAEAAGFDFVEMSDHYHPWLDVQGHSANTWVLYGHISARTERIGLVTGVTCPSYRYHPAIVAQQAATLQIVSNGRFTLGVGAGERLNEHVVGNVFPQVKERHDRFREALEIIRLLWRGGYRSYEGTHLQLVDARVFDLPDRLPLICVAAGGPRAVQIAAQLFRSHNRLRSRSAGGASIAPRERVVADPPDDPACEGDAAAARRHPSPLRRTRAPAHDADRPRPARPYEQRPLRLAVRPRPVRSADPHGHVDVVNERGWYAVVASETVTFRKSLQLWQRFTVESRLAGHDDKSVYLVHRAVVKGEIYAEMLVRARFLRRGGGIVPLEELFEALYRPDDLPPLDDWVETWAAGSALPSTKSPAPSVWE